LKGRLLRRENTEWKGKIAVEGRIEKKNFAAV